jgi:hypothetical protein
MVGRGGNGTFDNHCAINRSTRGQWHSVNQFLASKNPRAHSSNLVCANRQGDLVIFVRGADLASRQGAGPQMVGGALINASRRHRRELIVLTLPPRYHRPLHQLPASRLLPPRSGLERSDFVLWPA